MCLRQFWLWGGSKEDERVWGCKMPFFLYVLYIYIYGVIFFRILRLLCLFLLIIKKWFLLNLGYCTVQVILNDPFLGKRVEESNYTVVPLKDEFLENARLFIFETYCRIHERINMGYKLIPLYSAFHYIIEINSLSNFPF